MYMLRQFASAFFKGRYSKGDSAADNDSSERMEMILQFLVDL